MRRIGSYLILGSVVAIAASGCGGGGGGGKTPQDAFNNMVEAAKKDDLRGIMVNTTKQSQKVMTGMTVMGVVTMKQLGGAFGGKVDMKEIDAVMTKHGVKEDAVMEKMKSLGGPAGGKDAMIDGATALGDMVKDGPAFMADLTEVMKKNAKDKFDSPSEKFKSGKLTDVKIEGERATGKVEVEGRTDDIHFAREDGAWKVDLIPMFKKAR